MNDILFWKLNNVEHFFYHIWLRRHIFYCIKVAKLEEFVSWWSTKSISCMMSNHESASSLCRSYCAWVFCCTRYYRPFANGHFEAIYSRTDPVHSFSIAILYCCLSGCDGCSDLSTEKLEVAIVIPNQAEKRRAVTTTVLEVPVEHGNFGEKYSVCLINNQVKTSKARIKVGVAFLIRF